MDSISKAMSKVMTVSYGTFSCQLEGFDDPFTTMQLVAEYFRKLAAEDRYFGGEPLQPDADTLHKIARDANPNKVDAEVTENSVILRQATVVDAAPVTPTVAAPVADNNFPAFASRRAPRAKPVAQASSDNSYVAATEFSSRRAEMEPAAQEPVKPAAEILLEEDLAPEPAGQTPEIAPEIIKTVKKVAATVAKDIPPKPAKTVQKRSDDIQQEEEALERLLETTNSKLATPSHARRSNALERLKAAVAATEAERSLRGGSKTSRPKVQDLSVDPNAFRKEKRTVRSAHEDTVQFSRPKLNRQPGTRTRSSVTTLILGNEQQVAQGEYVKKKPAANAIAGKASARPKPALEIVQNRNEHLVDTRGFAAFVEKSGASTLHQLLEASAAYLAIIEDQPRFSQERLVANLTGYLQKNEVSPEATSRSLNRLLRDGRILRVKADRYTLSKSARHGFQEKLAG